MRILGICLLALAFVTAAAAQKGTVNIENGFLLGTPDASGRAITPVVRGMNVEVIATREDWSLVQTAEYVGWIKGSSLLLSAADTVIDLDTRTAPLTATSSTAPPVVHYAVPATPSKPRTTTATGSTPTSTRSSSADGRTYFKGPRGGCYYLTGSGKKTYVDHSYCGE